MFGNSGAQLEIGLEPWPQTVGVMMRGGAGVVGQLVAFDLDLSDAATTSNAPGVRSSGLANVRTPVTADASYGQFCVLQDPALDDGRVEAIYQGFTYALVQKNAGSIAAGDPLFASANTYLDADGLSGDKVIARCLEAVTTPATAVLAKVAFSGIHSLGVA